MTLSLDHCVVAVGCNIQLLSWSYYHTMPDCTAGEGKPGHVILDGVLLIDAPHCRGNEHGTVFLRFDPMNCIMIEFERIKTYLFGDSAELLKLIGFLKKIVDFDVIAGVSFNDPVSQTPTDNPYMTLILSEFGVFLKDVEYRGSFAFVTQKATNKKVLDKVVTQEESNTKPAYVNAIITRM